LGRWMGQWFGRIPWRLQRGGRTWQSWVVGPAQIQFLWTVSGFWRECLASEPLGVEAIHVEHRSLGAIAHTQTRRIFGPRLRLDGHADHYASSH
jgi:hypothetical protein